MEHYLNVDQLDADVRTEVTEIGKKSSHSQRGDATRKCPWAHLHLYTAFRGAFAELFQTNEKKFVTTKIMLIGMICHKLSVLTDMVLSDSRPIHRFPRNLIEYCEHVPCSDQLNLGIETRRRRDGYSLQSPLLDKSL